MADVVAFVLEASPVVGHQSIDAGDVGEGVAEDEFLAVEDVLLLPRELPLLDLGAHEMEGEIHRSHVERAHLRLEPERGGEAILDRHLRAAAGGQVDDRIGLLVNGRQELGEDVRIARRRTILGIAGVQMEDGGARLRGRYGLICDVLRPVGKGGGERRRMDGAGDRAGDDDFVAHALLPWLTQAGGQPAV